ncbi:MAG: hypothetical protein ACRDSO_15010, partial [Pseudonocardiaceae bacterium]
MARPARRRFGAAPHIARSRHHAAHRACQPEQSLHRSPAARWLEVQAALRDWSPRLAAIRGAF